MTEPIPEKKGMSKGCLIGLIVLGVVIVIIAVAAVTCYMNKDAFMKFGVSTMVNGVKDEAILSTDPMVDSTTVIRISEAFLEKFNAEEVNYDKMAVMGETVRTIMEDKKVNAEEINQFLQAMIDYYPELEDLLDSNRVQMEMPPDSLEMIKEAIEGAGGSE